MNSFDTRCDCFVINGPNSDAPRQRQPFVRCCDANDAPDSKQVNRGEKKKKTKRRGTREKMLCIAAAQAVTLPKCFLLSSSFLLSEKNPSRCPRRAFKGLLSSLPVLDALSHGQVHCVRVVAVRCAPLTPSLAHHPTHRFRSMPARSRPNMKALIYGNRGYRHG